MITGINTDVRFKDTVYHVQTEDRRSANPVIESLIYVKGAILDSHRSRYADFLHSEHFAESTLQEILEYQHIQIITAIKNGEFKKGMALKAFTRGDFVFELDRKDVGPAAPTSGDSVHSQRDFVVEKGPVETVPNPLPAKTPPKLLSPTLPPKTSENVGNNGLKVMPHSPLNKSREYSASDSTQAVRHRSDEPVESSEQLPGEEREGIEISVEGSKEFYGGSHVDLSLCVEDRQTGFRLENVQVIIKIIGTAFSMRLYAGKTDNNGQLRMNINLPSYSTGTAALIIQASSPLGKDEIKYLIRKGTANGN